MGTPGRRFRRIRSSAASRTVAFLALVAAVAIVATALGASGQASSERFVPVQAGVVVPAGGKATVGIRVRRSPGSFERRKVRALRVPDGLRVRWTRETENGDLTVVITGASDLTPGRRRVFIAYQGGAAADIRVFTPAPRPTLALTLQPSVLEIAPGEVGEVRVAVQRIGGLRDPVALTASATGAVTAALDPTTLTLRVTGAGAGSGQVVVTARAGGEQRTATVAVRVAEPPVIEPSSETILRNDVKRIPVTLQTGQAVTLRVVVEAGDVDLSAFDAAGTRLAVSANGGSATEELSLVGPGQFEFELRAVVNSVVRISGIPPG